MTVRLSTSTGSICIIESDIKIVSVPLISLSQEMDGLGTPSAVQENRVGSGDTTVTFTGGTVMVGATVRREGGRIMKVKH